VNISRRRNFSRASARRLGAARGTVRDPAARRSGTPAPPSLMPTATAATREPLFTGAYLRICGFSLLTFLAAFQLFPTIPLRLLELGASQAAAGAFLTAYTWASALSAPLTGALGDRFGHRRVLIVAAGSFSAFSLLYGVVTSFPLLLAIGCLHGCFWSAMLSASGALVIDTIPESRRTEGFAWFGMAPTAAVAVAPAIGLFVYRWGWLTLMVEVAALSLLVLLLAVQVREGRKPGPQPALRLREAIRWRVVAVASTIFAVALGYGGSTSYAALLAMERGIEPHSLFFTAFALTVLFSRAFISPLADRRGPLALLYPALTLVPVAFLVLAGAETRGGVIAAGVLFGLGFGTAYPAFIAWVLARTDPRHRGATFGSVLFALDTAIGSGSLLVGAIGARTGLDTGLRVAAAAAALALPLFLLTRRLLPEP
jgi:MFS family permease